MSDNCCICGGFVGTSNFKFINQKLYHTSCYQSRMRDSAETFFNPVKIRETILSFDRGVEVAEIFGFENLEDWQELE